MPKNVGGGKRYKKRKSKVPAGPGRILYPDEDQMYGIVTKRLGNGWVNLVVCDHDGENVRDVLGRIRGILRKRRVRFMEGAYVIACSREFENAEVEKPKVDVIHKYYDEHVTILNREGKIPIQMRNKVAGAGTVAGATSTSGPVTECDIIFEDDDDIDIDDI